jgi:hypothetical protein
MATVFEKARSASFRDPSRGSSSYPLLLKLSFRAEGIFNKVGLASFHDPVSNSSAYVSVKFGDSGAITIRGRPRRSQMEEFSKTPACRGLVT